MMHKVVVNSLVPNENNTVFLADIANINTDNNVIVDTLPIKNNIINSEELVGYSVQDNKYIDDDFNLIDSLGTIAYVNKEYGFTGVLRASKSTKSVVKNKIRHKLIVLNLLWIKTDTLKQLKQYSLLANSKNPIDITSQGLKVLEQSWVGNGFSKVLYLDNFGASANFNNFCSKLTKEEFISSLEVKKHLSENCGSSSEVKDEQRLNEETTNVIEKEPSEIIEDTKTEKEDASAQVNKELLEIISNLENKLSKIIEKETTLNEIVNSISNKQDELSKKIENTSDNKNNDDNENLISVNTIVESGAIVRKVLDTYDNSYEIMLKTLSVGDNVSLPFDYYSKIKVIQKKMLSCTGTMTFEALSTIKFDEMSQRNIFVYLYVNERQQIVRLLVLKEFNDEIVTDNDIQEYYSKYLKWKKEASTRFSI